MDVCAVCLHQDTKIETNQAKSLPNWQDNNNVSVKNVFKKIHALTGNIKDSWVPGREEILRKRTDGLSLRIELIKYKLFE